MKVAIVGAGQIADAHLTELARMPDVEVVGLCDLYESPLTALADKYGLRATFTRLDDLLVQARPDVVHVTTPPGSHFPLGKQVLEAGCHLHMEKPFTVTHAQTEELIALAEARGLKLCINTNRVFSREYLAAARHIADGDLGRIAHMDAVFSYNLKGPFGRQVLANPNHWIARLPGQVFQNNLSHPLSFIVPHLGDALEVSAWAADLGGNGIVLDEVRVNIVDRENQRTAHIAFSCGIGPSTLTFRAFGTKRSLTVDNIHHTVQLDENAALPGNLGLAVQVSGQAAALARQFVDGVTGYLLGRENYFSDMNRMFRAFYAQIDHGGPPAVSHREIWRSSLIMERTIAATRREVAR